MNIIIIDDAKEILKHLVNVLEYQGHYVVAYFNPLKALNEIPTLDFQVDLIISDYIMFDMDGINLILQLKESINCKYVLFTSFEEKSVLDICANNNITYINKKEYTKLFEMTKNV